MEALQRNVVSLVLTLKMASTPTMDWSEAGLSTKSKYKRVVKSV